MRSLFTLSLRAEKETEDRGQRTEDRGQRTEDRGQRTVDRGQLTDLTIFLLPLPPEGVGGRHSMQSKISQTKAVNRQPSTVNGQRNRNYHKKENQYKWHCKQG